MSEPAGPAGRDRALATTLGALAACLAAGRFYRLRPFLDEPHAFRQAWTAYTALDFYRFDMNIFLPSIIAMGNYRHILIEFPVPEWITALIYHLTGPTLIVDRLVSIAFFLGSAIFLFRVVALVQDRLLAWIVVTIYLAAPLGIYYSRAVHIDSAALCFGHALVYYFVRYGETGRRRDLAAAALASALGLLVKAPYVFFLILPALFVQLARGQRRRVVLSAVAFTAALAVGVAWYLYAQSVNRQAPDLSFVSGYEPTADRLDFYLGAFWRRFNAADWGTIVERARVEIAASWWWVLAPLAVVWRRRAALAWGMAATWLGGSLLSVSLFFSVNVIHHYYQLILIAPFALWAAIPIYRCLTDTSRWARPLQAAAMLLVLGYAVAGARYAVRHYYQIDREGIQVGEFVHANTGDRDLVIMAFNDAYYLDPRYLYYADRRGWSVRAGSLEPRAIEGLRAYGATTVVTSDRIPAPEETRRYLEGFTLVATLTIGQAHVFVHRIE